MLLEYINEKTGFADREPFQSSKEVKEYFTIKTMRHLFGDDFELSQAQLDEMRDLVIRKKWNLKEDTSKVFSVRINRSSTEEEITEKLKELKRKIEVSFL